MAGRLAEVHRFPVKSMLGEALTDAQLDGTGVAGDRAHALLDVETGKVASAKDPRRWAALLGFAAAYVGAAASGAPLVVGLPDGGRVRSDDAGLDARLSEALGRAVRFVATPAAGAVYDDLWPDVDGMAPAEFITGTQTSTSDEGRPVSSLPVGLLAPGTFQDVAPVTILTSASLARAAALAPDGRWDTRRFRPNLVLDIEGEGFLENEWSGRRIAVGEAVVEVLAATPRCVMTTLAQDGLPADRSILQTVARHNRVEVAGVGTFACLGAYASVVEPGRVTVGDPVRLL
jgi:uncharacterized protein YcbX